MSKDRGTGTPKAKRRTRQQEYADVKRRIEDLKLKPGRLKPDDRQELDRLRLRLVEIGPLGDKPIKREGQLATAAEATPPATGIRIVGGGAPGLGKRN